MLERVVQIRLVFRGVINSHLIVLEGGEFQAEHREYKATHRALADWTSVTVDISVWSHLLARP